MALSENGQKVIDLVKEMKATELNEMVKALEEEFGVSAAPVVAAGGGGGEGGAADEGQTSFNVELSEVGQSKIAVVKAVKEVLGLGLKEAKELVEGAPAVVKENVGEEEGEQIKSKIEEAGGTAALK